jgi:dTDP-4-dehydrorhamnose reductase/dTDP-4-dehydrorhamnose 3,5-epimerase-like enzyme
MTIPFTSVANFFEGLVQIDIIKSYSDSRGYVSEVFRNDDPQFRDAKQCYISETKPLVQRGVHQHNEQTDDFISINNRLLYRFVNPITKEVVSYTTNPGEITRVIVKPPILHSYINLSESIAFTMNFPDQLFKGINKSKEIDEIRYEKELEKKPLVVILGSNGRLGKSLTKAFLKQSSLDVTVVPIDWKFQNIFDVENLFRQLDNAFKDFSGPKFIINTIANTNTQDGDILKYTWPNIELPNNIEKFGKEKGFTQIFISTDYVFQKDSVSAYTLSKKLAEFNIKYGKIIRVANLWQEEDETNGIIRLHDAAREENVCEHGYPSGLCSMHRSTINIPTTKRNNLTINPKHVIFPTNTDDLAEVIVENYKNLERINHIIPEVYYNLREYIQRFYKVPYKEKENSIEPWHEEFISNSKARIFSIKNNEKLDKYINSLKNTR